MNVNAHRMMPAALQQEIDLANRLAELYWTTPRPEAIAALVTSLAHLAQTSGQAAAQTLVRLAADLNEAQYREIAIDYTTLFCGFDAKAPFPYESIYLGEKRLLMQTPSIAVKKVYAASGYTPEGGAGNEPLDHLATELRFLMFLLKGTLEAFEREDVQHAEEFLKRKDAFLEEHMKLWIPSFCREVDERAQTDFFRELSALTEWVVCTAL